MAKLLLKCCKVRVYPLLFCEEMNGKIKHYYVTSALTIIKSRFRIQLKSYLCAKTCKVLSFLIYLIILSLVVSFHFHFDFTRDRL